MLNILKKEVLNTMEKGPIHRSLFCNGACYLFHEAQGFSGAKVSLSFLAGSYFESDSEHGIAHLLEHLVFKETKSKNIEFLENFGAVLNAYTYKETICFEMECHSDNLSLLLPVFLDHFTQLDISYEQFEKEKQIILHELKEDEDDYELQGIEELFMKNFPLNIGHPVGGTSKSVKKLSIDNVNNYFKRYFKSNRLILTIVSGNDSKAIEDIVFEKLEKIFPIQDGINVEPIRLHNKKNKKKLCHFNSTKQKKIESSISFFSFNGPKVHDHNYYDYLVLDEILFEGLSSLFFKKLRDERPLVYGMGSSVNSFHDCGMYMMVFRGQNSTAKAIKKSVSEVMQTVMEKGVSSDLVEAIKKRMFENWEVGFDSLEERLEFLTDQEVYVMGHKSLSQMRLELDSVNVKSIQSLVKKIFITENNTYMLYKKKEK